MATGTIDHGSLAKMCALYPQEGKAGEARALTHEPSPSRTITFNADDGSTLELRRVRRNSNDVAQHQGWHEYSHTGALTVPERSWTPVTVWAK